MYKVHNQPKLKTIYVTMSGMINEGEMAKFAADYTAASDTYGGTVHLVLADMRGLKALSPRSAAIMQEAIAYDRARGTMCCAHISDQTVTRLQTARLAREISGPDDPVTVNVVSMDEAEKLLTEKRLELRTRVP